jgi:hypothetical protein
MMAGVIIEYHIYYRTGVECEHDSQKTVGYTPRPFEANWPGSDHGFSFLDLE